MQVIEMLVANEEQAFLSLRKSKLIDLIYSILTQYFAKNQRHT